MLLMIYNQWLYLLFLDLLNDLHDLIQLLLLLLQILEDLKDLLGMQLLLAIHLKYLLVDILRAVVVDKSSVVGIANHFEVLDATTRLITGFVVET